MENEKILRKEMRLPLQEGFIMFIAVGNYKETFISPKSERDNIEDVLVKHN